MKKDINCKYCKRKIPNKVLIKEQYRCSTDDAVCYLCEGVKDEVIKAMY